MPRQLAAASSTHRGLTSLAPSPGRLPSCPSRRAHLVGVAAYSTLQMALHQRGAGRTSSAAACAPPTALRRPPCVASLAPSFSLPTLRLPPHPPSVQPHTIHVSSWVVAVALEVHSNAFTKLPSFDVGSCGALPRGSDPRMKKDSLCLSLTSAGRDNPILRASRAKWRLCTSS